MIKRLLTLALGAFLSVGAPAACAQHAVDADPSVNALPDASFEGRDGRGMWAFLNGRDFWEVPLAPPAGYYDPVEGLTGDSLRLALHDLIDDQTVLPYTHPTRPENGNHQVDVWDVVALADRHPDDRDAVICVYTNRTMPVVFTGVSSRQYDREHAWPKSHGFSKKRVIRNGRARLVSANTTDNPAWSDCHHLFACERDTNTQERNNTHFGPRGQGAVPVPTAANLGRGGPGTPDDEANCFRTGEANHTGAWQVWTGRRGDIARAMFYMALRYDADTANEPDLVLVDDASRIDPDDNTKRAWELGGVGPLGLRATLLGWHDDDPVDDLERRRNTVVFLFQGNRNPFVDRPDLVDAVFRAPPEGPTPPDPGDDDPALAVLPWINELHYDNSGRDAGEFIEVAGPAGLDLAGWRIVLYNGSDRRAYADLMIRAQPGGTVIPDQQNGMGAIAFEIAPIQNGPGDGVALVSGAGEVIDVIAYEGALVPADGPAAGAHAPDIGVAETGATPPGRSLQLGGAGCVRAAFAWLAPAPATPGAVNVGQEFANCP